ncbi:hypothetical protein TanjilG_19682 [Lupinus angustifolius]|uniref:BZIP domain-containing protein n=1 Tax=Lupinus angustifolius TaxID=3871 RepID=A0A1J7HFH6_LUPAN|nr:hypothetical protein TanjilG_19682 [Lupinus angustifolius]
MAQLPPKIPNMPPSWPEFSSHQKVPSLTSMQPNAANNNHQDHPQQQNNPSWVDEFLDFSSARRGAHRRSVSDSITFMEPPKGDDDHNEFERFDDAQFLSMFNDEVSGNHILMPPTILCTSNPSSPSDHNSINDDHKEKTKQHEKEKKEQHQKKQLKNELEDEDESQCKQEITEGFNDDNNNDNANATTCSNDRITDPKRVKRLLLNIDNSALKQRIAALAQDKIFKDAHQEALKREIDRLRQVYHQQNMKQMDNTAGSQSQSPKPICDTQTEKEHLINV